MLYYYKVKKRPRYRVQKLLVVIGLSTMLWSHVYPGSFANMGSVLESTVPSIPQNFVSPTPVDPENVETLPAEQVTPKTERRRARITRPEVDINKAIALAEQFKAEKRLKEYSELKYSIDLLANMSTETPEGRTRARIIRQEIGKTMSYFKAGNAASNKAEILGLYEGGNLAYVYYPNYGVHFNPVTTCNIALSEYSKGNHKKVLAIADELLDSAILREYPGVGKYFIWEYYFDLEFNKYKFDAPWASGMAQGLILDVLGKSYKISGDRQYLRAGELVLNSFKVPFKEGGVTDYDDHGNWYLEVAATNKLRILNGFLFALYSIHNYHIDTGNTKAKKLFDIGIAEAKEHVQEYDLGHWSNYSLVAGDRATYAYHKIHADLLYKLFEISKEPKLKTYADKFMFYYKYRFFNIPPTHRSYSAITSLAERSIINGEEGWFGAQAGISRAELIVWLSRGLGWQPSTTYKGFYKDIKRDHKDWGYIESAFEHGLKLGDASGAFGPSDEVNRAELAAILCKTFAVINDKPEIPVKDLSEAGQYQNDVRLALSNGFMNPYEPNYFRPACKVTREQVANILYRLLDSQSIQASQQPAGP